MPQPAHHHTCLSIYIVKKRKVSMTKKVQRTPLAESSIHVYQYQIRVYIANNSPLPLLLTVSQVDVQLHWL